jgi:hypothetical protein
MGLRTSFLSVQPNQSLDEEYAEGPNHPHARQLFQSTKFPTFDLFLQ